MKTKLILLCAPSGTGKTTVARILTSTDDRFRHVRAYTTRTIRGDETDREEKVQISLEELESMNLEGHLVNFNEKDGDHYGIRGQDISSLLQQGLIPVLEWDVNRIDHFDATYPVFKVILLPQSKEAALEHLGDGRDPKGKRRPGVLKEIEDIEKGIIKSDTKIKNEDSAVLKTVMLIREHYFQGTGNLLEVQYPMS